MKKLFFLVIILTACGQPTESIQDSIYDEICTSLETKFDYKVSYSKGINLNISNTINTLAFNINSQKIDSLNYINILSQSSLEIFEKIEKSPLKGKILNIELVAKHNSKESTLELTSKAFQQIKNQFSTIDLFLENYRNKKHLENYSLMDTLVQKLPDTTFISYFNQMQEFKGELQSWEFINFKPEKVIFGDKEYHTNAIIFQIKCKNYAGEAFFRFPFTENEESKILGFEM